MKIFHKIIFRLCLIIFKILPISNDIVLFKSFNGQYNDNPKYISERLYKDAPDVHQYWIISERCHEISYIPDYVAKIQDNTIKCAFLLSRAKVLVDNGAGWFLSSNKSFCGFPHIKKTQFNMSTWHGTPLKRLGADSLENQSWEVDSFNTTSNMMLCGSHYIANVFKTAYYHKLTPCFIGTPRNDVLFQWGNEDVRKKLRQKLELPENDKLVLYAPTYRNSPEDSGLKQMKMIDTVALCKCLSRRFGGNWKFVFRAHNVVLNKLSLSSNKEVINGNRYDDMAEYLLACDAVITDYSGILFDVCLCNMPCFLFSHDVGHYADCERGVYIPIEKLPYKMNESFEDLKNAITNYDKKIDDEKKKEFLYFIGNTEKGTASYEATRIILDKIGRISL